MSQLMTISDAVYAHARVRPNHLACRDSRRALTYLELNKRASALGSSLLNLGLNKGDRVAVIAYNSVHWFEIYVGLARAGLVAVPLNFRLSGQEIEYILLNCEARGVIAGPEFEKVVDTVRSKLPEVEQRFVALSETPEIGWIGFEELMAIGDENSYFESVSTDDMCALMYTSGTTGKPKGAIRQHAGSFLIGMATALEFDFSRDDIGLLVMPLCHANSLYFFNTFITLGATCIVEDSPSFDPERLLRLLSTERVTFTSLVPTHYIMILSLPDNVKAKYDTSSVGKLLVSSAPARRDTKQAILDFFKNGKLYELYGSTEAGWVTLLRPDEQLSKLGSVGREWAGSGAIRLLDEHGKEVPDGQVGELFSRTTYVFNGYWRNEDKTREAFNGFWCSVGDMARRDEDGYIWLVDRKSNMIISGGENIYPSEVETVVGAHDAVKDVAVIGVPHDKWGETVMAIVVLHEGKRVAEDAMRIWCRSLLAGYKCPTRYVFIEDNDMPRTATGKILHRLLRDRYAKDTALAAS